MSSRLPCWLHGHDWSEWEDEPWENLLGWQYWVRWCYQCGAMDRQTA